MSIMFIREKKRISKRKKYLQFQLIESIRTANGPRQKIILNLGQLKLEKDKWKDLANRIESKLHNQAELFIGSQEIEKLSDHYVKLIRKNKLAEEAEKKEISEKEKPEYESVDINSLLPSDGQTIGAEHVVLSQMREYQFDNKLKLLGFDSKQIKYAKMLIVGRIVYPSSERETARWLNEDSGLKELLQTSTKVYDNVLHRTAKLLWENHDSIERNLAKTAKLKLNLKEDIILYDLTNTYFAGTKKDSKIAKPGGKSKEKRNDRPLVTLALTVDSEGFPKKSKILEGNISEPETLKNMLDELKEEGKGRRLFNPKITIVIDAGIATEENLELISDSNFSYIAVSRKKSYADNFWATANKSEIKLSDGKSKLRVKLKKTEKESFLLCYSETKKAKEQAIFKRKLEKFEEELKKIKNGLHSKRPQRCYEKIMERIGRAKEKYKVGNLYDIVIEDKKGLVKEITFEKNLKGKARENKYGEYVLRTNRIDLSGEEISKLHRSLTTVEASFKAMKSELGMRPNFHKRDMMSVSHIFITVISYHFLSGILKKLRTGGITYCWNTVRKILSSHIRVTSTFNTEIGDTLDIRNCTVPTQKQQEIYNSLKIGHNPLKRVKTRRSLKGTLGKCSA